MSHHTMTIPWRAPNAMSDSIAWSSGTFMLIASALPVPVPWPTPIRPSRWSPDSALFVSGKQ